MPIIWRYILSQYIKILMLCVFAFMGVMIAARLDAIAQFASLGTHFKKILLFAGYQIPYILPLVLPVACLVAATVTIQRLSSSQEITALRAAGFSLKDILAPLLLISLFIGLLNFYIASEIAPVYRLKSRFLERKVRSFHPLLLVHSPEIARKKGVFIEALSDSQKGVQANDFVIALPDRVNERIHLILGKKLQAQQSSVYGENISLITAVKGSLENQYDHLVFENVRELKTPFSGFLAMIYNKSFHLQNDYLKLGQLLVKKEETPDEKALILSEIARRLSLGLFVITFTFLGATFAIHISRVVSKKGIIKMAFFSTLSLAFFFGAKRVHAIFELAFIFYFLPHVMITAFSAHNLSKLSRGIE